MVSEKNPYFCYAGYLWLSISSWITHPELELHRLRRFSREARHTTLR